MLNEEERRYLSSTRLSVKINYVELNQEYENDDIFYYYGTGIIISTITNETYIDKNYYKEEILIKLLNDIYSCLDTTEVIIPEDFISVNIINKTFNNLNCRRVIVEGTKKITYEQLLTIDECSNIKELKVPDLDKNITQSKFKYKIIPIIKNKLSSEKFKNFIIDDILRLKALNVELPLAEDTYDKNQSVISEEKDLQQIIDVLVDIDSLTLTILDDGKKSINDALKIIEKINQSIGSKIENIYFITGNRNIQNIELLKEIDINHKLAIMYDKEAICSLDDFINMRKKINKIIEPIKKVELSPLEKTLFAYDIIKNFYIVNKKYIKEKKVSKYIHRIFKINDLNCQAYAALYAQILRELKINAVDYSVYTPLVKEVFLTKENHARTIINLVDEKYGIQGLYNTDIVWDAIKKEKNNYHYEFFLTKIKNLKKQFVTDKFHKDIEVLLGNEEFEKISPKDLQLFQILLNKNKIDNNDIEYLKNITTDNISLKTFISALSAVRVAQGRDKKNIKEELVAIVNKNNKQEKYTDKFYSNDEEWIELDIAIKD